ncbi:putative group II intron reverse transcriptase/maturase [Candidatus Vecturithrix granuli]|uniref:Putative group II intron reverse transcriptase/maturase n=1 Tax=Vecturithrix granuli TaxID=1499967 RepID=A0A081BW61_VECG1|nr:putative group II intron reverse transcriptase/maturase [Candidatus Vecturithrix granuli]
MLLIEAQKYLDVVRKRGEAGPELKRVYYNLATNQELYLVAYANLYANKGALTPGTAPEDTADGMSLERIGHILDQLKRREYQWKPTRRPYILKREGRSKRPVGMPGWEDKLLQEVIRLLLNAYYELQFKTCSHGFRPTLGCHTALWEIKRTWKGVNWFIEGDIKGCFDNIDHEVTIGILRRHIKDETFLMLLRDMLKAGYLEDWKYHHTYSGTPQGGIVSPLLANIVLNELDTYVEETITQKYTRGKQREVNRENQRLRVQATYWRKKGDVVKAKELYKVL